MLNRMKACAMKYIENIEMHNVSKHTNTLRHILFRYTVFYKHILDRSPFQSQSHIYSHRKVTNRYPDINMYILIFRWM